MSEGQRRRSGDAVAADNLVVNAARSLLGLCLGLAVSAGSGCLIFSPALPCGDDAGCDSGFCVDGMCDGDVVGEGEGEGDAGEGEEGEGDVVADCVADRADDFDGVARYLGADVLNPTGSSATVDGGTAHLDVGAQPGKSEALLIGPTASFVDRVVEVDLQVPVAPAAGGSVGLVTKASNTFNSDVELRVELFADHAVVTAAHFGDAVFDSVDVAWVAGTLPLQLRLDGEHPVVFLDGVRVELSATASADLRDHRLALFARCADGGCPGAAVASDRLAVFGACRP